MTYDLYGGTPPHSNATTSLEAAEWIQPHVTRLAHAVLDYMDRPRYGHLNLGCTVEDVERDLGMKHQTAGARMRELVLAGIVRDSGRKVTLMSGRRGIVWERVPRDNAVG